MSSRGRKNILLSLAMFIAGLVFVPSVQAQSETTGLLVPCDQTVVVNGKITLENPCTINHFLQQFLVVAQWGQSLVILLGVLFIIWGGIQWITAGGRASKIEDGRKIVLGTIVGIMISMTAYIIINFTVGAITGTSQGALNPFSGPISTIFGGSDDDEPTRPFSGTDGIENRTNCRATWDRFCGPSNYQIFCADPGTSPGKISEYQELLNQKNCFCDAPDGCFGERTAVCVRRFQIANNLPATGIIDQTTASLITGTGNYCTDDSAHVNAVNNALPAFSVDRASRYGNGSEGCCIVKKDVGGIPTTVMCADKMRERTCLSLGANNVFIPGELCLVNTTSKAECGFCHNNGKCFQQAGKYWCENIVQPGISFSTGACRGNSLCETAGQPSCQDTLYTDPNALP